MNQHQVETEVGMKEARTLEVALKALWDKARRASELILNLKEDNKALHQRVNQLEQQVSAMKAELVNKEAEIGHLREEQALLRSNGNALFTKEEKEALQTKIKELIEKINSHL